MVGEVISLVGLAHGIWSEVDLSDEEKSWQKGGDVANVVILVEKSEN